MIKIDKGPCPTVLSESAKDWTTLLERMISEGQPAADIEAFRRPKYGHKSIKEAVKAESHGKCAYCESKPLHVSSGQIDHVVPKSVAPQLSFEWSNLIFCCEKCNQFKSNHEGFIDPVVHDPEACLQWAGPMVFPVTDAASGAVNEEAKFTVSTIRLNRAELLEQRKEALDKIILSIESISNVRDPSRFAALKSALVASESAPANEYSACAKSFLARYAG